MWVFYTCSFITGLLVTYHGVPGPLLNKISSVPLAVGDIFLRRNEKIFKWHQKYGSIVCISPNEVSVASIDATRKIYSTNSRYDKSNYFDNFKGYGANHSIFATKLFEEHKKKRKLTFSFYQASTLYTKTFIEEGIRLNVRSVLEHISILSQNTSTIDVYSFTDWYAFDNITRIVLGPVHCSHSIKGDSEERRILRNLKHCQLWGPFRVRFPWAFQVMTFLCKYANIGGHLKAELELAKWCRDRALKALRDIKVDQANSYSLIHNLLSRKGRHKQGLDNFSLAPDFIEAEVLDNINAAEATVSVTATYAIYYLSREIKWQTRIRNELLQLPRELDGLPTFANINKAPVLDACLMEVYRLKPAVSGRAERVIPDGGRLISGVYLPEKTIVSTSVTAIHHNKNSFTILEEFAPQQWLDVTSHHRSTMETHLIPFGYGARLCLGKPLATMEIKLLLAGIYLHYETRLSKLTTEESMKQTSTHDAVPRGLNCEIQFCGLSSCNV
ncbi:cytochrome P450 [Talaromyces proteolyticus]|uniref:Cytochrome P450 n=1 Tax=Talaromyces proteolyticus TaxID=1131652 RepID=A0AAD4KUR9_9EURO|nr:cytochrome P450 [Talaromyces proteolyticus]KAH8700374.1 cytochrome P450 [Talaromyces proteolyticus]